LTRFYSVEQLCVLRMRIVRSGQFSFVIATV
jgi:hypothetical protein